MIRTVAVLSLLFSTSAFAAEPPAASASAEAAKPAAEAKKEEIATLGAFTYVPKETDIVYGKDDAPVTLVEYASLSCPHCAAFYTDVLPELKKKYIDTGKVRMVFRHYPLNGPAMEGAQLVNCADKSRREAYLKVLFTTQSKWAYDNNYHEALAGIAVLGGMDRKSFDACVTNKDVQGAVLLTYQEARESFKVTSTPALFVGTKEVKGNHNFATVSKALEEALAAASKK